MITVLHLAPNPRYSGRKLWGKRSISSIKKIIVHQELGEGDTKAVHNYHISKESHLKEGGAPKIAYHFTIEKTGQIYSVNDLTDVVWHTAGQNTSGIGIMLCGDFDGPTHIGKSKPTDLQKTALIWLLDYLTKTYSIPKSEIYGHTDFGKKDCPGNIIMEEIKKYKDS